MCPTNHDENKQWEILMYCDNFWLAGKQYTSVDQIPLAIWDELEDWQKEELADQYPAPSGDE